MPILPACKRKPDMPPNDQTPIRTGMEIDYGNHTIRFVRSFDAPASLIFEAWTRPEQLRCWWDAAGEPLAGLGKDLRPRGALQIVFPAPPPKALPRPHLGD